MISNKDYVHLHCHSEFSSFDGLQKIDSFVLTAKLMGFPAIALTDHGNVGGWIKFTDACKKNKFKISYLTDRSLLDTTSVKYNIIKDKKTGEEKEIELEKAPLSPILGEEFYLARDHELSGKEHQPDGRKGNRHLLLLAKNKEGYKNLCTLSQRSWTHGQFHNPRIDFNLLAQHSKGIICSSACLSSVVNNNLLHGRYDQARKAATLLKDIFGDDFYLSVMFHGIDSEGVIIPDIIKLGKELDVKIVAENDCHYCTKNQSSSQELLMATSMSKCIKDPNRMHYTYPELYIKSAQEMYKIFGNYPEILYNTLEIANRIENVIEKKTMRLPEFDIKSARENAIILNTDNYEKGKKLFDEILSRKIDINESKNFSKTQAAFEDAYSLMSDLTSAGFYKLGWHNDPDKVKQLKIEMEDVRVAWESNQMDFASYFLMVWDYVSWAKSKGILTGCGRGSGFASIILRCLGITYGPFPKGMIWERFLGFDQKKYLNDDDWGFNDKEEENIIVDFSEEKDDFLDDRPVEEDAGGVDRY